MNGLRLTRDDYDDGQIVSEGHIAWLDADDYDDHHPPEDEDDDAGEQNQRGQEG